MFNVQANGSGSISFIQQHIFTNRKEMYTCELFENSQNLASAWPFQKSRKIKRQQKQFKTLQRLLILSYFTATKTCPSHIHREPLKFNALNKEHFKVYSMQMSSILVACKSVLE